MTQDKTADGKTQEGSEQAEPAAGLLEILVCPVSRKPLEYDRENQELISREAGLAYPVRQGIPIMLESEARRITKD